MARWHGEKAQRSSDSVLFVYIAATFTACGADEGCIHAGLFEFLRFGLVLLEVTELQSEMFVYGLVSTLTL